MTYYLAHYIDSTTGYYAANTFDEYLEQATLPDVGRPIRTYTITARHYNQARSEVLAAIDTPTPRELGA